MTYTETAIRHGRHQTLANVVRAERFRLFRPGGMRTGLIVSAALGAAGGIVMALTMSALASEISHIVVTSPIELCAFLTVVLVALVVAARAGRDENGHSGVALSLVPRRVRLYAGRILATIFWAASATLAACLVVAVLGVAVAGAVQVSGIAALAVVSATLATVWLALCAFGLGTIVRSAPASVLILLGILVVLPLGVGVVGSVTPMAAPVAEFVTAVTPGQLLTDALAVSGVPRQGMGKVVGGQLGLAAWGIIMSASAGVLFQRRDARLS